MDPERVTLRPFRVSDADNLIVWAGDDQVTRSIRWIKTTITSKEESLAFIKEVCIPHPFCRSICIDDRSIGYVFVKRCWHRKKLAPEKEKAASILSCHDPPVILATVDANDEANKELALEFEIRGFPTLMLNLKQEKY